MLIIDSEIAALINKMSVKAMLITKDSNIKGKAIKDLALRTIDSRNRNGGATKIHLTTKTKNVFIFQSKTLFNKSLFY